MRDPELADLWTGLVLLAYTQLRLARSVVADQRLPWERSLDMSPLTPYRVRHAFCTALSSAARLLHRPAARRHARETAKTLRALARSA